MDNRKLERGNMIGKNALLILAFSGLCLLAGGCGFQPLYSHSGAAGALALGSVKILNIKNRSGQKLRNFLLERMGPSGHNQKAIYSLQVKLAEKKNNLHIRKDGSATRSILSITAEFILTHNAYGGKFKGSVWATSSYNALGSNFATLSAENDARNRTLRSIAEEIRLRVAVALKNSGVFSGPKLSAGPR